METVKAKTVRWARTRRGGTTLVAVALAVIKAIADSGSLSPPGSLSFGRASHVP